MIDKVEYDGIVAYMTMCGKLNGGKIAEAKENEQEQPMGGSGEQQEAFQDDSEEEDLNFDGASDSGV